MILKKFKEKAKKKNEKEIGILSNFQDPGFIPYACHYDKNTILTKTCAVVKTIKIPGFSNKKAHKDLYNIREIVRNTLKASVKSANASFWFHTIRKKQDINIGGTFDNIFSEDLDKEWTKINHWEETFVNEIYITIVARIREKDEKKVSKLKTSLSFFNTKKMYLDQITVNKKIIDDVSSRIVQELEPYGAYLIGIAEDNHNNLYSEHSRLINEICNLEDVKIPLNTNDISEDLITKQIAFGKNEIEIQNPKENKKQFATIISLKQYLEITPRSIDKIIQLPFKIIITEFSDFVDGKYVKNAFARQNYLISISKDTDFSSVSGLNEINESNTGKITDYGIQQLTIMLFADTTKELEKNVEVLKAKLDEVGFLGIKEDIFMPRCFWSQIPGNFNFLSRLHFVMQSDIGGFASLHHFPVGQSSGRIWGHAISIFQSIIKTPYFFNMHSGKVGHTAIVGPKKSGKSALMNFILSQTNKIDHRLYYISVSKDSEIFVRAINGVYYKLKKSNKGNALSLNPLLLAKNENNFNFLVEWIETLISYNTKGFVPIEKTRKIIQGELDKIPEILQKALEKNPKTITDIRPFFNTKETQIIYKNLEIWCEGGRYSLIFNNEREMDLSVSSKIGFDLSPIVENNIILIPTLFYLLYKLEIEAKGEPTVIAIDNAWRLFDNSVIGVGFADRLKRFTEKNASIIFIVNTDSFSKSHYITDSIKDSLGTTILLPNKEVSDYYAKIFNIEHEEINMLGIMNKKDRNFILKNKEDIVISSLDLSSLKKEFFVLSGGEIAYKAMTSAITTLKKKDSREWLGLFYETAEKLEQDEKLKKQKESERRQIEWEKKHSLARTSKKATKEEE
jgi:type IV secretion system protein VirB4